MPARKLLALALLAGLLTAASACADVTGPRTNNDCAVTGSGQVCTN